ncbi:methionine ABC transporter ATP-binding protein [Solibacillus cecembensis]|uniref:methionine ABC transporter ATP-binding protein n=1 Tax=Solibacillus cecembensis TaxID=459347 RepID=UPI003D038A07
MIEFQNVTKEFHQKNKVIRALNGVSLTIEKGDIFGVIGYSGAGKSTLLRLVNALEKPTTGKVLVDGKDIHTLNSQELVKAKKKISIIFQHFNLLESKTVFDNVALPLLLNNKNKVDIEKKVTELLAFVGLEDKANSYPYQLSGGQKQRVGIARALVINPEILLCDEATSALDPKTTASILELLGRVNKEFNITILMITHEMEVIRALCNKVAVMEYSKVIESGNVIDVFGKPQHKTTQGFVKTVIPDELPESIITQLYKQGRVDKILRLKFVGDSATQPLLNQISKQFNVVFTIIFATVTELQGQTLGVITVAFEGDASEIEKMQQFIGERNVLVEEVIV